MRSAATAALSTALVVVILGATVVSAVAAPARPDARLTSEAELPGYDNQGVARVPDGWILSGTVALTRVDEQLNEVAMVPSPIPEDLATRGYNHVGDVDVVRDIVFTPLEQPDYDLGEQVMARYDARTLEYVDSTTVPQHHASFVSVDPKSMIAYSTDQFTDDTIVRYDVRRGWKRLRPLRMSRPIDRIQGGDLAKGALWLSTDDDTNGMYRVDLRSGRVRSIGSAGHVDGEGEGIDATLLPSGLLHVLTVDPAIVPVWFSNFAITRGVATASRIQADPGPEANSAATDDLDPSWPPVLVGGALILAGGLAGSVVVMLRRARVAARATRGRR